MKVIWNDQACGHSSNCVQTLTGVEVAALVMDARQAPASPQPDGGSCRHLHGGDLVFALTQAVTP